MPNSAARRAEASQPNHNGNGVNAGESATLQRSQSPDGILLPSAALPAIDSIVTGAGGTATSPGGETSRLELGPTAVEVARQAGRSRTGQQRIQRTVQAAKIEDALPSRGVTSRRIRRGHGGRFAAALRSIANRVTRRRSCESRSAIARHYD